MAGHRFRRLAAGLLVFALSLTAGTAAAAPVEARALPLAQWLADLADRLGLDGLVGARARSGLPPERDRPAAPDAPVSASPGTESAQGQGDGETYPSLDPNG